MKCGRATHFPRRRALKREDRASHSSCLENSPHIAVERVQGGFLSASFPEWFPTHRRDNMTRLALDLSPYCLLTDHKNVSFIDWPLLPGDPAPSHKTLLSTPSTRIFSLTGTDTKVMGMQTWFTCSVTDSVTWEPLKLQICQHYLNCFC